MKKQTTTSRSAAKRRGAKQAKPKPKPKLKAKAAKPGAKAAKPKRPATAKRAGTAAKPRKPAAKRSSATNRWVEFVEEHGVVLASAKGPVPSVAEAVAGEPIVGSWWSHPEAQVIFEALSEIDDSNDIRCFKLVDHKVTFVHRRRWPALAKLAQAGVLEAKRVASIQQEHMPTGEHRNFTTPYPDWVPEDVVAEAEALSVEDARAALGSWV